MEGGRVSPSKRVGFPIASLQNVACFHQISAIQRKRYQEADRTWTGDVELKFTDHPLPIPSIKNSLRASYVHQLSRLNGGAVVGEVNRKFSTNENTLTVGGSYVVDPETVVKARLNNHGNLGALLQHQLTPKSSLTLSAAFDTKALERHPNFGLALSLKP
ncbi:hypothetical protein C1H46_003675 [Malus baccata]|uniref:Porin domain-containing protein n=1 Tax=Malus baccata TaxID=106549 RepID=A0A540NIA3_MALBA|nr:hypothetical protein C1H46_003675 [Malus baccata]